MEEGINKYMFLIILFIFVFIMFIIAFFYNHKRKLTYKVILCTAVLLFLALVYFRPFYFKDTEAYSLAYDKIQWDYLTNINLLKREPHTGMEYGFVFIELIFKSIGFSFRAFSLLISATFILCVFVWVDSFLHYVSEGKICKSDKLLVVLLFLPYFGLFYNFVAIRSALSFSLLLLGSIRAMKRNFIGTVLCFFAALSIQRLSIVGLVPLIFILMYKLRLKLYINRKDILTIWMVVGMLLLFEGATHFFFTTIGLPVMNLYNSIINSSHRELYDMRNRLGISKILLMLSFWLTGLPFLLKYERNKKFSPYLFTYFLSLFGTLLLSGNEGSYRVTDYLYIYTIPLNYWGIKNEKYSVRQKMVLAFVLTCLFTFYWGIQFVSWMLHG